MQIELVSPPSVSSQQHTQYIVIRLKSRTAVAIVYPPTHILNKCVIQFKRARWVLSYLNDDSPCVLSLIHQGSSVPKPQTDRTKGHE